MHVERRLALAPADVRESAREAGRDEAIGADRRVLIREAAIPRSHRVVEVREGRDRIHRGVFRGVAADGRARLAEGPDVALVERRRDRAWRARRRQGRRRHDVDVVECEPESAREGDTGDVVEAAEEPGRESAARCGDRVRDRSAGLERSGHRDRRHGERLVERDAHEIEGLSRGPRQADQRESGLASDELSVARRARRTAEGPTGVDAAVRGGDIVVALGDGCGGARGLALEVEDIRAGRRGGEGSSSGTASRAAAMRREARRERRHPDFLLLDSTAKLVDLVGVRDPSEGRPWDEAPFPDATLDRMRRSTGPSQEEEAPRGQHAVVTGGSPGLGVDTARFLVLRGASTRSYPVRPSRSARRLRAAPAGSRHASGRIPRGCTRARRDATSSGTPPRASAPRRRL